MQANIYIGTSGRSYPRGEGAWNGYLYPAGEIGGLAEAREKKNQGDMLTGA